MEETKRKRYEMLLRLRDFDKTHSHLFESSPVAQEAFASVNAAIDELTRTDLLKMSASASARADRLARARKAISDLLLKVSQLARVLREGGMEVTALDLPESRSDQTLLTAARQFAQDTAPFAAEFDGHGIGPKALAESIAAFDKALHDRGMKKADHSAARLRIGELIATALRDVRRLDLMLEGILADNPVVRALWKSARRVTGPRGPRSDEEAVTDTSSPTPPPAADTPVPAAVDAPRPATVIEMPSREAA